jgi:hypothetical protein
MVVAGKQHRHAIIVIQLSALLNKIAFRTRNLTLYRIHR